MIDKFQLQPMNDDPLNGNGALSAQQQPEIDLRAYWEVLTRRKGTVAAVALLVFALGAFWTFIQKPVYTARGTLLIEKEPNILSFEQVLQIEAMRDDFYQTQYKLLESRTLAGDVITRLNLARNRGFAGAPAPGKPAPDPTDVAYQEQLIDRFLGGLEVKPVRMTRLVQVGYRSGDARLASDCVNGIADAFIDLNINMKYAATEQATEFLSGQIATLQTEIQTKEKELQNLEAKANIVVLSDQETTVINSLGELNAALTAAQIDRVKKEAVYNQLKNATPDSLPEDVTDPLIAKLREDYARVKAEVKRLEERFQPDYPELVRLNGTLQATRKSLEDECKNLVSAARADYQTALQKEKSLGGAFNSQKNAAFKMNSSAVLYNGLKVEIQNKKVLLDSLLRRQSETGVEARLKGLRTSNIRIVDRARPPLHPSSPNKKRNLILALLLGLGGGVGLAFLFDHLDNSIKTAEDVEKCSGLPTLGIVPKFDSETLRKNYYYGGYGHHGRRRREKGEEAPEGVAVGATGASAGGDGGNGGRPDKRKKADGYLGDLKITDAEGRVGEVKAKGGAADGGDELARIVAAAVAERSRAAAAGTGAGGGGAAPAVPVPMKPSVPRMPVTIELAPYHFPNSRLAETYRSIRTSLLLSSAEPGVHTIGVTSAMPGEGKTVTVVNLAIVLAQLGKRVVIVDSDLRKPRQHRILQVKNTFGITGFLVDSTDPRLLVKPTTVPNMFLVNTGPVAPNPAELLGSPKMEKLIAELRGAYDYVLFDLPPMMEISDAMIVGSKVDGLIMVVHGDKTPREALTKIAQRLRGVNVRTLGVVINNTQAHGHSRYYYEKGYGRYYGEGEA